jgi:predicted transcriptional regulator
MINFTPDKIEIALLSSALKRSGGIEIWTITSKLGISVRDAAKAFQKLRELELLIEKNDVLRLTTKGRDWIMQNQSTFAFSGNKHWRAVPEHFESSKLQPFEPYAPRLRRIDKKFFGFGN